MVDRPIKKSERQSPQNPENLDSVPNNVPKPQINKRKDRDDQKENRSQRRDKKTFAKAETVSKGNPALARGPKPKPLPVVESEPESEPVSEESSTEIESVTEESSPEAAE